MKSKLLLLSLSVCLISGCIPAAFVAGATAGGAIIYDNRSVKTMAQDRETTIKSQYRIDQQLQGTHISVATFNHIALLVGQAQNQDQIQTANNIVNAMPSIKRIYNEITIEPVTSTMQRSKDTWITTKTKTAMLAEKGLQSSQIKVVTENNTVYLMGLVTRTQGNLAAEVVSKVRGVQKVVKLFEYMN